MNRHLVPLLLLAAAPAQGLENAGLGPIEIAPLGPSIVFREPPPFLLSPPRVP
jgi:hypothetical protein